MVSGLMASVTGQAEAAKSLSLRYRFPYMFGKPMNSGRRSGRLFTGERVRLLYVSCTQFERLKGIVSYPLLALYQYKRT